MCTHLSVAAMYYRLRLIRYCDFRDSHYIVTFVNLSGERCSEKSLIIRHKCLLLHSVTLFYRMHSAKATSRLSPRCGIPPNLGFISATQLISSGQLAVRSGPAPVPASAQLSSAQLNRLSSIQPPQLNSLSAAERAHAVEGGLAACPYALGWLAVCHHR